MSLSRFRHLEGPRPEQDEPPETQPNTRIAGVGGEPRPARPAIPDPFAGSESLELATPQDEKQPFIRCARCESDNHIQARLCAFCGNNLRTEQQKAFNAQLWTQRQEELKAERTALEELHEHRAAPIVPKPPPPRAYGEALAEAEAEAERIRQRNRWDRERSFSPAFALLKRIENPTLRWGLLLGSVLVPVLLIALSHSGSNAQLLGFAMLAGLVSLCMPTSVFRNRRRWFDD